MSSEYSLAHDVYIYAMRARSVITTRHYCSEDATPEIIELRSRLELAKQHLMKACKILNKLEAP